MLSRSTRAQAADLAVHQRPQTPTGDPAAAPIAASRSRAIASSCETDNAHVLALNRFTGECCGTPSSTTGGRTTAASSAPLPAGNLVISGVTGGEHGANGFVAAHDQETGKEVWRFWTVPKRRRAGIGNVAGQGHRSRRRADLVHRQLRSGARHRLLADRQSRKEYNGDHRQGDNLYSDSILALDRKTGTLKWHYQFTPHDLWDWDATETSVLVDADWQGKPRKLMLHANRNGFFYVFDRRDGTLLLAKQFIKTLTWASGIGTDGRPIKLPDQEPIAGGTKVCPSQDGATNWYSPSFNPATRLYYIQTFEKCSIYTKRDQGDWESGKTYLGGSQRTAPDPKPRADSACPRHPHGRDRLGTPAAWPGISRGAARSRPPPAW